MPKYLIIASYTAEGAAGLLQEGGSGRVDAVTSTVASMGGSIESFYFAFGDADAYVIADVPDVTDAAAIALAVGSSGRASTKTVCLLTPAQVDEAVKKAPGLPRARNLVLGASRLVVQDDDQPARAVHSFDSV